VVSAASYSEEATFNPSRSERVRSSLQMALGAKEGAGPGDRMVTVRLAGCSQGQHQSMGPPRRGVESGTTREAVQQCSSASRTEHDVLWSLRKRKLVSSTTTTSGPSTSCSDSSTRAKAS